MASERWFFVAVLVAASAYSCADPRHTRDSSSARFAADAGGAEETRLAEDIGVADVSDGGVGGEVRSLAHESAEESAPVELPGLRRGDRFLRDRYFSRALSDYFVPTTTNDRARTFALAFDEDGDGDRDVIQIGGGRPGTGILRQNPEGRWSAPEALPGRGNLERCITIADVLADPAWDLVCIAPNLTVVEGELLPDGNQRIAWDRTHVVTTEDLRTRFQGSAADPPEVKQVLVQDIDRDGLAELILSFFAVGSPEVVFWQREPGVFEEDPGLHVGMTFGAMPWLRPRVDEWGMLFFTESGEYIPDENYNSLVLWSEAEGFVDRYESVRPQADADGYIGPPRPGRFKASPMAAAWWRGHLGAPPLLFLATNRNSSGLFEERDGHWFDQSSEVEGFWSGSYEGDVGDTLWGSVTVPLRGLPGAQSIVSVAGVDDETRAAPDEPIVVWLTRGETVEDVGPSLGFRAGGHSSLQAADFDSDGRPDLLVGGHGQVPEIWHNRMRQHGNTLHLEVLGAGHDALVEVTISGVVHRQQVTNSGNAWVMGPPEVFIGVGDADAVDVRVIRASGAVQDLGSLEAGSWAIAPDAVPVRHR